MKNIDRVVESLGPLNQDLQPYIRAEYATGEYNLLPGFNGLLRTFAVPQSGSVLIFGVLTTQGGQHVFPAAEGVVFRERVPHDGDALKAKVERVKDFQARLHKAASTGGKPWIEVTG